jgi:hypothetical protein
MTATHDMARSELRVLVTKAARGAGLPWGLAEEAGWAADWLVAAGLPAAEWAADWLAALTDGRPDPVTFGVGLADEQSATGRLADTAIPEGLSAPGYLLPFMYLIARRNGPVELSCPRGRAASVDGRGAVTFGPAWSASPTSWRLHPALPELWVVAQLEALALRTTVPASDASRRDAGSDHSDND